MPTLAVCYRQMETNLDLQGGLSGSLTPEQDIPLQAPDLALPDPAHPGQFIPYKALFWNVRGPGNGLTLGANTTAHVHNEDVVATAWYYAAVGGPGPSGVRVWTFSETQDRFLPDIPIQSVDPPGIYDAVNNPWWVPTGTGDVEITAKGKIAGEDFDVWMVTGAATVMGAVLKETKGQSDWAIAAYKVPEWAMPFIEPEMWERLEDIIRKLPDGDPPTIDLRRWWESVTRRQISVERRPADELSYLIGLVDRMNEAELRDTLASVQAQMTRLMAAEKIVQLNLEKTFRK
jgi:hypothetical protein